MGAGIAVQFRKRYPAMFAEYRQRCKAVPRRFNPGDVFLWRDDGPPMVFNLATQDGFRRGDADIEAVERSLAEMRRIADHDGILSIGMPRIGAGLGGLEWADVRAVIDRVFGDWTGELTVFEEYVPAGAI